MALLLTLGSGCIVTARAYGATMPAGTVLAYTLMMNARAFNTIVLNDARMSVEYQIPFLSAVHLLQGWITRDELLLAGIDDRYVLHHLTNPQRRTQVFDRPPECQTRALYGHGGLYACPGSARGLWILEGACITARCSVSPRQLIPESLIQTWEWSPDGTRIAFFDAAPFTTGVVVIDVYTEAVQRVTDTLGAEVPLISWSPDGTMLAYYVLDRSGRTMQVYDLVSEAVVLRVPLDVSVSLQAPEWSPDGTRLAYTTSITHSVDVVELATGETRRILNSVANYPRWSPDGHWIAYSVTMGQDAGIHLYHIETGESRSLVLFDPMTAELPGAPYAWRPCPESGC
ncbi:MAG: hypothetical protein SF123_01755 [Chloroflexota bacterium]|nr:hypothetical protein [Chloroflexota bacterium]